MSGTVQAVQTGKGSARICVEPGCTDTAHARGVCRKHYNQAYWLGYTNRIGIQPRLVQRELHCSEPGCGDPAATKGKCRKHYYRDWSREHGVMAARPKVSDEMLAERLEDESPENLARKLSRAAEAYACAVSTSARVFWRREIEALKTKLEKASARPASAVPAALREAAESHTGLGVPASFAGVS